MSDNNIEEKEILEEQVINEEAFEESVNEVSFAKRLGASIVDEVSKLILSIALLYIFEGLLKLAGYYISQKFTMLFIIFIVVSILYTSIMENIKDGKTIGKKLMNL
jgi:uncharacterized RDD family membrane protein YckC